MCPSLTPKSKKERPQESFQLINTSNLSNLYSTSLKSFRMVVYDVSSIVSKNRNVSDGKLLPTCISNPPPPPPHIFLMLDISSNVFIIWSWIELIIIAIKIIMLPKACERSGAYERGIVSSHCHQDTVTTSTHSSSSPSTLLSSLLLPSSPS